MSSRSHQPRRRSRASSIARAFFCSDAARGFLPGEAEGGDPPLSANSSSLSWPGAVSNISDELALFSDLEEVSPDARMSPVEDKVHPNNQLNALGGKRWIRFTRSWFVHNPPPRSRSQIEHPAKFPEPMIAEFIEFFTKPGESVLDPFMGVGSTVLAAARVGRVGIGMEINPRYFALAHDHLGLLASGHHLFNADATRAPEVLEAEGLAPVDFIITSPPYWDMLSQSRGNVFSTHKARKVGGLDVVYSDSNPDDLGNIKEYDRFVNRLADVLKNAARLLRQGRYMVVIIQNLRSPEGKMVHLAWDLTTRIETFLVFKGEKIWCQDNKKLGIWGYPSEFVSNVHHHYCLIFKK